MATKIVEQASYGYYGYNQYGGGNSFTVPASYNRIDYINARLYRTGTVGTITMNLYAATAGGLPTGSSLGSATVDGSTVTTSTSGAYYTFNFTDITVTPGNKYAYVLTFGTTTNLKFKAGGNLNGGSSVYSGGVAFYKGSGSTYTAWDSDLTFEVWGYIATTTPTVSVTDAATNITSTTATLGGTVSSDGGSTITERGVCWSTSSTPTTANSKATSAGTTGSFTVSATGLTASTTYYARAYATNANGTSYGSTVSFSTSTGDKLSVNVDSIYIEVFYEDIPVAGESPTSSVTGTINSEKEYQLSIGDVSYNGQTYSDVTLVLDIEETMSRGTPIWSYDTNKTMTHAVTWIDQYGRSRDIFSQDLDTTTYEDGVGYDDSGTAIPLEWESQNFRMTEEKEEGLLQDIFIYYRPHESSTIPLSVYARTDVGAWSLMESVTLMPGSDEVGFIRVHATKAIRGRYISIKLTSTSSVQTEIYGVIPYFNTNKSTRRPTNG